jgi:hypothetical protein
MSTLWTPGGERPIRRDPPAPSSTPPGGAGQGPGGGAGGEGGGGGGGRPTDEELRAEMDKLREQLAQTPAEVVVANHAFGLFELAALHLSLSPPQLDQARLAIDALAALVDGLGSRLGDASPQLSDGLSQLRMAYVQIHAADRDRAGGSAGGGAAGA